MRITITVEPWVYDPANVELRVHYESGPDIGEDRQFVRLSEFDSLFDLCIARASEGIKRLMREQRKEEKP